MGYIASLQRFYSHLSKFQSNIPRNGFSTLVINNTLSHHTIYTYTHYNLPNNNSSSVKYDGSTISHKLCQSNDFSTNVTSKLNWDGHFSQIVDLIKDADFVALDVEYTGLHMKDERFIGVEKCYESHVLGAKKFIPCQIGLTMAKFDRGTWKVIPTSIFTIPSDGNTFSVNMSTFNFLKDNNFDFNSWIRHGISHLKPKEEEERKSLILSKLAHIEELKSNLSTNKIEYKVNEYDLGNIQDLEDRKRVEAIVNEVKNWLFSEDKEPLEFEVESAFLRLLIHSVISIKFPNIYSNSCKKNDKKVVRVYKSQLELLESERATLESELREIDREVGLRILFDTISKQKKILVGHNCFYDILHVYQTFYQDLPETVEKFKTEWVKVFPKVFDTKYISEFFHMFNPQSSLKMLYESVIANSTCRIEVSTLPGTKWDLALPGSKTSTKYGSNVLEDNRYAASPSNRTTNGNDATRDQLNSNNSGTKEVNSRLPIHGQSRSNEHIYSLDLGRNSSRDKAMCSNIKKSDEHDAGYDSFMTGMVFIHQLEEVIKAKNTTLANLVSTLNNRSNANEQNRGINPNNSNTINNDRNTSASNYGYKDNTSDNDPNKCSNTKVKVNGIKAVPTVINKVFSEVANSVRLVKCQPSVINMETQEDMSRHFYMFGFPNSWKKWEIMKIWSPLWVSVSWIDESSCWVVARNQEDVKNINLIYKMMKNPQFKLYNYGQYLEKIRNDTPAMES